jgi:hypothetical protein
MKPSHAANDNQIAPPIVQTRQVWEPRLGRSLTDEDARQVTLDVTGFFAILAEWSRAENFVGANDNTALAKPDGGEVQHES